jgi:hypothetical protein
LTAAAVALDDVPPALDAADELDDFELDPHADRTAAAVTASSRLLALVPTLMTSSFRGV